MSLSAAASSSSDAWGQILGLTSSFVAIIIGVFAIWLSLALYRMASGASDRIEHSANAIGASIDRLNSLYDRLYNDLFTITKDTVSDMRRQLWPTSGAADQVISQAEERADARIADIKRQVGCQLRDAFDQIGLTTERVTVLQSNLMPLVNQALEASRSVAEDARTSVIREFIVGSIDELLTERGRVTADDIVLRGTNRFSSGELVDALIDLRTVGTIDWRGTHVEPDTELRLTSRPQSAGSV